MKLTEPEKKELLNIARLSILELVINNKILQLKRNDYPESLLEPSGAFVSIYSSNNLRGCIGQMKSTQSLVQLVANLSRAAASRDYRFRRIEKEEMENLHIEISILTPLTRIKSIDEIKIGIHGVYIKKGSHQGVLLPQVALRHNWNTLQFLEYCSEHKAGLEKSAWKNASVFVFEATVFGSQ